MNFSKITLGLFVILCTFSVQAKMYKCSDTKGNVSYSSSPCQGDQREDQAGSTKKLQEEVDYYSRPETKEKLAREAQIVAERREAGSSSLVEDIRARLEDAINRGDHTRMKYYSKQLELASQAEIGNYGAGANNQSERNELGNAAAQNAQMEMQLRDQKTQMENKHRIEIHRMESQQRLIDQGILRK